MASRRCGTFDLHELNLTCHKNGNSVVATVTDYLPYFYVAVPRGFRDEDIEPFKSHLNVSVYLLHHDQVTNRRNSPLLKIILYLGLKRFSRRL